MTSASDRSRAPETCRICGTRTVFLFTARILGRYNISYFRCPSCRFVQTEEPSWLDEAYADPITLSDTGILLRNEHFAKLTACLLFCFFDPRGRFLDYAGGYGIFTRLMRDIGFDYAWQDKHTANLLARGFEHDGHSTAEAITAFEAFEHFVNPIAEIESMLKISRTIIFTTLLTPDPLPAIGDWWYYLPEHGQHISLFAPETLRYLASKYGLRLYSNGVDFHMLTDRRIPGWQFRMVLALSGKGLFHLIRRRLRPRTEEDSQRIRLSLPSPSTSKADDENPL